MPPLRVRENGSFCRLSLGTWAYGNGHTLQEAADALVNSLLQQARQLRSAGTAPPTELGPPDHHRLDFLWQVAEMSARGEDVRARVFG